MCIKHVKIVLTFGVGWRTYLKMYIGPLGGESGGSSGSGPVSLESKEGQPPQLQQKWGNVYFTFILRVCFCVQILFLAWYDLLDPVELIIPFVSADHNSIRAAGHVVVGWAADRTERLVPQKLCQAHLGHHDCTHGCSSTQQKHEVSSDV